MMQPRSIMMSRSPRLAAFQNPFSGTAANMSIAENLALAAYRGKPRGRSLAIARRNFLRNLRDHVSQLNMGFEDRLRNPIGSLAGGQRQAFTLIMATWPGPRCCCWTNTPPRLILRAPTR